MRTLTLVLILLAGLALVLPTAPTSPVPGRWTVHNATWDRPPAGGIGNALRTQTVSEPTGLLGFGSATMALPDGLQVEDLEKLVYRSYFESGGCGGGSPRWQLAIDTDSDGDRDANVFAYGGPYPSFSGCPLATWEFYNVLDGNLRWDSTQLGGPFYGNQSTAQDVAGPAHQVLSIALVWDSTWLFGDSVIWIDELRVNCFIFGEPAHMAISVVSGISPCP